MDSSCTSNDSFSETTEQQLPTAPLNDTHNTDTGNSHNHTSHNNDPLSSSTFARQAPNEDDHLPQPHNSNHMSSAPLREKLLTSSSYLAAEIPLKFGHFMNHLWMSGSEFLSDSANSQPSSSITELWLLGCQYELPNHHIGMQQDMMDAQKENLFMTNFSDTPTATATATTTGASTAASSDISTPSMTQSAQQQEEKTTTCDSIVAPMPTTTTSSTTSSSTGSDINSNNNNNNITNSACATAPVMSVLWPPDFYADFTSRYWMTYRFNYPPIRPSKFTTDVGWGCMLRSGQSLLANTLLIHFLSREWRRTDTSDPCWKTYRKITHWFLDELSARAPFSIHRIALLGKQLGKDIGQWFGPSTISQVIQALVSDFPEANMAVYIATDGVIYRKGVEDVATGRKPRGDFGYLTIRTHTDTEREEAPELYKAGSKTGHHQQQQQRQKEDTTEISTFKSTLVLVPLRLGIKNLHQSYYPALKACFRLPYFVGIAGGKPMSSLYFMGLQDDELIYIDPHKSKIALETKNLVDYTEQDLATYHCTIPYKIHISQLDPSMMLGFYCRDRQEFDAFCEEIAHINRRYSAIFTIEEQAPDYDEDVRSEHDFGVISGEEDEKDELESSNLDDDSVDSGDIGEGTHSL